MSYKNTDTKWNIKILFSCVMCLLISLMFLSSIVLQGFTISKLLFGCLSAYFCIAFFRKSRQ